MRRASVLEYLTRHSGPIIDVRSPAEFQKGHISGAVNIPLLDDQERHQVGTYYVQKGRQQAIELGLKLVGPKMAEMARRAGQLDTLPFRRVYCWRGGMRSEKTAWLFELTGMSCAVLQGGYKAFRNAMLDHLRAIRQLVLIQGPTGSGKTETLHSLAKRGFQVLDLEGLARHKGSAYGHLGQDSQPTSQQFHNDLFMWMLHFDLRRPVFVEAESACIGKVNLPDPLWLKMKNSPVIHIDIAREARMTHLMQNYGGFDKDALIDATTRIRSHLGGQRFERIVQLIREDAIREAISLVLEYYDAGYERARARHPKRELFTVTQNHFNPEDVAAHIEHLVKAKGYFHED
ncbi:MAG: tRNA 2-selenouridine(34) synthase MnmH [Calditrichaeota bacterium]|nr:MAG: tRNA 2-selenouridine(34) synthase MnmH [Calditrichota bacterium]